MGKEQILATATELGLSMRSTFVPFSESRHSNEKMPSLNWKVALLVRDKTIIETDYSAGCGHCPSYKQGRLTVDQDKAMRLECERGLPSIFIGGSVCTNRIGKEIMPDVADVIHSFASDSDAIDYGSFEEWAENMGYDTDSRSAEKIYRACLEIGLKLRSAIGEDGLNRLREACQDY